VAAVQHLRRDDIARHNALRLAEVKVHALLEQAAGSITDVNSQVLQDVINVLTKLIGQNPALQLTSVDEAKAVLKDAVAFVQG